MAYVIPLAVPEPDPQNNLLTLNERVNYMHSVRIILLYIRLVD